MRALGPALGTAGALTLAWVAWELLCFVWLRTLLVGAPGVWVFHWMGPGATGWPDGSAWLLVGVPCAIGAAGVALAAVLCRLRVRVAWLFALGGLAAAAWAVFAVVVGFGTWIDSLLVPLPVVLSSPHETFDLSPWSRWIFDAGLVTAAAVLLGFGPAEPVARRALWIGLLAVLADSAWRVSVVVLAGQVPVLGRGFSALGEGLVVVWVLLAGLAALFVALFANVPAADGPRPHAVLVGLAACGLWLGLQAAALWSAGLIELLGKQPRLFWQLPEYDGLLAGLRLALLAIGSASLALAAWRDPGDGAPA